MTEKELKEKMDVLGQMMHEKEVLEFRFEQEHKELFDEIEARKQEIREAIMRRACGFDSSKLKISYRRGAIRWDSKALDSYGVEHPEIMKFRKQGEPTVGFTVRSEGFFE